MKLTVNFVDAFTNVAFKGNSAAVIQTDNWLAEDLMQKIAAENNLSETAFLVNDNGVFDIRWFSPLTEIDFCGHATLASAFVLFNQMTKHEQLTFRAKAVGELKVVRQEHGFMQMNFPNKKPMIISDIPQALIDGLSIKPTEVYQSEQAYFVMYSSESDVLAVKQKSEQLKKLAPYDVVVTAATKSASSLTTELIAEGAKKYDFISRYFWPANGGDEDPVTGSIHAGLAPFWAEKLAKTKLSAYQASERGGELTCVVDGERVYISGQAIQYLKGIIELNGLP